MHRKSDPARLVFDAPAGAALSASLIDVVNRFHLVGIVAAVYLYFSFWLG